MDKEKLDISIVVPLLNEQDNLGQLYKEIKQTLDIDLKAELSYEIIFIDDGSTDNSIAVLKDIQTNDPTVEIIEFRRNYGQTAALSAGFEHARGKAIIAMDADLQNDPADIPRLLEKQKEGFDVVSGWRRRRHDNVATRKMPSIIANFLIRKMTGVRVHDFGCTLKLYKHDIIKETRLYGEMHRFIPALARWAGARVGEIVVNHRPRTAGVAKYGLARTFKVVLDLITVKFLGEFSTKPIYVFGSLGALCGLGSLASIVVVILQKIFSDFSMNRNPLLILFAILSMFMVQFIMMGVLAELMVRTYHESQNRPTYFIRKIHKKDD